MPFSTRSAASGAPTAAPANEPSAYTVLVLPIGVKSYDKMEVSPVASATVNALAWVVAAMRMKCQPMGQGLFVDEANAKEALLKEVQATLEIADLSPDERWGLEELAVGLGGEGDALAPWEVMRPTFDALIRALLIYGAALRMAPRLRVLITFSGHGALSQGCPVLCPADTQPGSGSDLVESPRLVGLMKHLATVPVASRRSFAPLVQRIRTMSVDALAKGVRRELEDVLYIIFCEVDDGGCLVFKDGSPVLKKLTGSKDELDGFMSWTSDIQENLARMSDQRGRTKRSYDNVITFAHLMLTLGAGDRRVTIVLDTCHSGGPGEDLQGSLSAHPWITAGMGCRILSASQSAQLAAEARLGERRLSAATWALTSVMSRWKPVLDGDGYALGIRNGDLVMRANLLLAALSFRQQISLHGPRVGEGEPSASDLPFMGYSATTRTCADPDRDAGSIQLTAGSTGNIVAWTLSQGGVVRAGWIAVGDSSWSSSARTYEAGKLYVLSTDGNLASLSGQGFTARMYVALLVPGGQSEAFLSAVKAIEAIPGLEIQFMPASPDPGELRWSDSDPQDAVVRYQRSGTPPGKEVYVRCQASPPVFQIITKSGFPFTPMDFVDSVANPYSPPMVFDPVSNPGFLRSNTSCWSRKVPFS